MSLAIAPGLRVGTGRGAATRGQIDTLIRAMGDEKFLRERLQWALRGLRCELIEATDCREEYLSYLYDRSPASWLLQPGEAMGFARGIRQLTACIDALADTDGATAGRVIEAYCLGRNPDDKSSWDLADVVAGNWRRALEMYFRAATDARVAAVRLAMRCYEIDHGRQPTALADLVGEYLPAVPNDPFSGTGGKIRLLMAPTPLLYSVGIDGFDDGGDSGPQDKGWHDPEHSPDRVYLLIPSPPATLPASTSPGSGTSP